jgi:hypothetical protein
MRVLVSGSRNWVDYNEIMRKMTVVLDEWVSTNPEDKKITFVHSGSSPAENMITEYIGKVEKLLRQKGYTITEQLVRSNIDDSYSKAGSLFDLTNLNIDRTVVFIRDSCKKTQSLANISNVIGIPTDVVKGW